MLESLQKQENAKKVQRSLVEGAKFPDFDEKDVTGKPVSVANYKGKVVLIDFWATWCGPCVAELPNVLKAYDKHHSKGFEIIGISLDQDQSKLTTFTKQKNMTWQQFFDGKGWGNKLAAKYGVAAVYPLRDYVDAGGLMAYGASLSDNAERAAAQVGKILGGTKPADLPVERSTKVELVVNIRTAKALGVTISPAILARADEVIE